MRLAVSVLFSVFIFLAGCKNFFVLVDYGLNRDFYEQLCENKDKPQMQCHGKCQVKNETEKDTSQNVITKLGLEFNIIFNKKLNVPVKPKTDFSNIQNKIFASFSEKIKKGFYKTLYQPPQYLV